MEKSDKDEQLLVSDQSSVAELQLDEEVKQINKEGIGQNGQGPFSETKRKIREMLRLS